MFKRKHSDNFSVYKVQLRFVAINNIWLWSFWYLIGCGCLKFACLQKVQPMYYEIVLDSLSVMLRQDSTVQKGSDILFCIPNIYLMTVLQRLCTIDDQELLCLCRWLYVCLSLWDQALSVLWLVFIEKSHLWMLHLELSAWEIYREAPDPSVLM